MDVSTVVMVSVVCLTYNHEKFIARALDGFVSQKTNFAFEVLVHDDASTDSTADIIMDYQKRYPDIIKPILQTENQYVKRVPKMTKFILPKATGKYIAFCEGDDFWSDPNKLQMQVEALEENHDCIACFGKVQACDYFGNPLERFYPNYDGGSRVIKGNDFVNSCLFPGGQRYLLFQLSGLLVRSDFYYDYAYNPPEYRKEFDVGDLPLYITIGLYGNVFYIDKVMSFYRTGNPDSASARFHSSIDKKRKHMEIESNGIKAFDEATDLKFHTAAQSAISSRSFYIAKACGDLSEMKKHKQFYFALPLKHRIKLHLLHRFPFLKDLLDRR